MPCRRRGHTLLAPLPPMLARLGQALIRARAVPLAAGIPPNFAPVELSDWRRWWKERGEDELRSLLMAEWDPNDRPRCISRSARSSTAGIRDSGHARQTAR